MPSLELGCDLGPIDSDLTRPEKLPPLVALSKVGHRLVAAEARLPASAGTVHPVPLETLLREERVYRLLVCVIEGVDEVNDDLGDGSRAARGRQGLALARYDYALPWRLNRLRFFAAGLLARRSDKRCESEKAKSGNFHCVPCSA